MSGNASRPGQPQGWNGQNPGFPPQQGRPMSPPQSRPQPPQQGWPMNPSQGPGPAMTSNQASPQQARPKRSKAWVIVISLVVAIGLIVALAIALTSGGGNKRGTFDEQWAQVKQLSPDGKFVMLEWRQGIPKAGQYDKQVDYLDVAWLDDAYLQYRTENPANSNDSQQKVKPPAMQNQTVTDADLSRFKEFIATVSCEAKKFRFARMVLLPDGTPMFAGGCQQGYNVSGMAATSKFVLDGETFDAEPLTIAEKLRVFSAVASHMTVDFAAIQFDAGGSVLGHSCLGNASAFFKDCQVVSLRVTNGVFPLAQQEASADADPFRWPDEVLPKVPAGLPSGFINLQNMNVDAVLDVLAQFRVKDLYPTKYALVFVVQHTKNSVAMCVYVWGSNLFVFDETGRGIQ